MKSNLGTGGEEHARATAPTPHAAPSTLRLALAVGVTGVLLVLAAAALSPDTLAELLPWRANEAFLPSNATDVARGCSGISTVPDFAFERCGVCRRLRRMRTQRDSGRPPGATTGERRNERALICTSLPCSCCFTGCRNACPARKVAVSRYVLSRCRFQGDWHHIAWLHTGGAAQPDFERKVGQQCTTAEFSSPKRWGWSADGKFSVRYATRQLAKGAQPAQLVNSCSLADHRTYPGIESTWRRVTAPHAVTPLLALGT